MGVVNDRMVDVTGEVGKFVFHIWGSWKIANVSTEGDNGRCYFSIQIELLGERLALLALLGHMKV